MDLDKPLEDLIADKRKSEPRTSDTRRAPRTSTGSDRRAGATPYARPPPRSTEDKWVHDAYQGSGRDRRNGGAPAAVAGTGAGFTGVSTRIEVIGLHYEVTAADLKGIFSQAGTLVQGPTIRPTCEDMWNSLGTWRAERKAQTKRRWVTRRDKIAYAPLVSLFSPYDRSGRSKGEATMEFASPQQAKIAINKFDGAMTKGQTISIRLLAPIVAKGRPAGAAPAGGAGGAASGQSLLSRIQGGSGKSAPASAPRGGRGGRGGPARGRGAPARTGGGGGRRGPTNQGDLDKELDSFMTNTGDVDMT